MRRDFIARELTREIVVGVFMVMIFLGLGYFTIILSREAWFRKQHSMMVTFDHVMGLREGDDVVVRGTTVGKVKELRLAGDSVHLFLSLDKKFSMREDYRISIVVTSILGGRYLQVEEGTPDKPLLPPDTLFRGEEPFDLMADAAEMLNAAKSSFVGEDGVLENIMRVTEDLREITSRLREGEGTLGQLLDDKSDLNTNLQATVAAARDIADGLAAGEGVLGKLLDPESTMADDLAAAIASVRRVADRLDSGEGTLGRLLSGDDAVYRDLQETVASLKRTAARIENGEGMIGRLVQDDTLYEELEGVVKEVRAAVDDIRETSPVLTFTSIFFGAF